MEEDKGCCGHDHAVNDGHNHGENSGSNGWKAQWRLLLSLFILLVMETGMLGFDLRLPIYIALPIYLLAWLLAGYNVLILAFRKALRLDIFNEFFLMSVATIGAFAIGAYSEGVAVMVFYAIGEWFQEAAVSKAKNNIKALLDIRPDNVTVLRNETLTTINASAAIIGDLIQVKPGEKLALDGILLTDRATFNTAALTGESKPDNKNKGDTVLAGMINLNTLAEIKVTTQFKDSKLNHILAMVQDATSRKSQTQLFISRFAKIYTPIVFALAVLVVTLPYFFVEGYVFTEWFYRGLVFLVISCPCALVVSIPLGYFGGIGLASKHGILFKGANFLDVIKKIDTVVMDKTGTLTKGVFKVQEVVVNNFEEQELVMLAAALESKSTHPIAVAITTFASTAFRNIEVTGVTEIAGLGLSGMVNGKHVLAGNAALMEKYAVDHTFSAENEQETIVFIAVNKQYAGYISIADELKQDAQAAIKNLQALNIRTVMLSGDQQGVVDKVAGLLNIDSAFGNLLPEDKVAKVDALKQAGHRIAFVGDGFNDAPVIALADAGIAMGGLGSDAAIATADIVIQNDAPGKIITAIKIGKLTHKIVWQNIILALGIKAVVLILGAGGVATLWEAVIADVGVALLAILNAVRIQAKQVD